MRGLDQLYPTARIDCPAKHINNTSMTHRFPIKEIALQSGLSTATIDRALNGRAHVSPQTQERVKAAISELEAQEQQLSARGRRLFVDKNVGADSQSNGPYRWDERNEGNVIFSPQDDHCRNALHHRGRKGRTSESERATYTESF